MQVPVIRTVCTPREYARACIVAWRALYDGNDPTQAQVGVLYAQWMVETGGSACWNWNIGNVKVTQEQVDAGVTWMELAGTWEMIDGKRVVLPEGDSGKRFRAFTSLAVAMPAHMAFLRNRRYAPSWPFVEAGDPYSFAYALKKQGYYTAAAEAYASAMLQHHKRWMALSAFDDAVRMLDDADEIETAPQTIRDFPIIYALPEPLPLESPELDEEPPDEVA